MAQCQNFAVAVASAPGYNLQSTDFYCESLFQARDYSDHVCALLRLNFSHWCDTRTSCLAAHPCHWGFRAGLAWLVFEWTGDPIAASSSLSCRTWWLSDELSLMRRAQIHVCEAGRSATSMCSGGKPKSPPKSLPCDLPSSLCKTTEESEIQQIPMAWQSIAAYRLPAAKLTAYLRQRFGSGNEYEVTVCPMLQPDSNYILTVRHS